MSKALRLICIGMAAVCWLAVGQSARADHGDPAGMLYSHGVHAYFSGNSFEAERHLSQAIEANPQDPRPYYFRAMSLWRQGRQDQARNDMQVGASLEARNPGRYAIGKSLERVQGSERLVLEDYRQQARLAEAVAQDQSRSQRYEHTVRREPDVLRREVNVSLDQLLELANGVQVVGSEASLGETGDPFVDDPDETQAVSQSAWIEGNTLDSQSQTGELRDATDIGDVPAGSKIKPNQLFGILGRVVGSATGDGADQPANGAQLEDDTAFEGGDDSFDFSFESTEEQAGDEGMGQSDFSSDDPFGFDSQPAAEEETIGTESDENDLWGDVSETADSEANDADTPDEDFFGVDEDDPFGGF